MLNSCMVGADHIYQTRRLSGIAASNTIPLAQFTSLSGSIFDAVSRIKPNSKGIVFNLQNPDVMKISPEDISLDPLYDFGHFIIESREEIIFEYGAKGIATSESVTPQGLLKNKLIIPSGSFGVLDLAHHVPFSFKLPENAKSVAITSCPQISNVLPHEENITQYSLSNVIEMPLETSRILTTRLQQVIFEDKKNENFYEEITSKVYLPTKYNRSSGTLMRFEFEDITALVGKTTDTHYHPGERSLYIITTNKPAGVTLNFCGIEESPDQRKDCEVKHDFKKNSLVVLNFPSYTHHKFHGEFTCMSIHPREGDNLIAAVQSGTLPKGFLETATVFSKKLTDKEEDWKLSLPVGRGRKNTNDRTFE